MGVAVPCRVKDVTLKKDMTMKKLRIVLLATCAVCTFGCNNDDDNTDPKLLLWEIGSSCNGNYFGSACSSDRTSEVECTADTDGIVAVKHTVGMKELTCSEGEQCVTLLFDNAGFSSYHRGFSNGCYGNNEKCDKPGEIIKCGISLIQSEMADIGYCYPADDGNNYISQYPDRRHCSDVCSEDGCVEKSCKQGNVSTCSEDKLIAYNCIANDFADLHSGPEYVISAQQCTHIAPCQINSEGIAECKGE